MPGAAGLDDRDRAVMVDLFRSAQVEGLVGPGPVDTHLNHAVGFAEVAGAPVDIALDLGSGAGIPGLVLALAWPSTEWLLLDGRQRSARFLGMAIDRLGLAHRVRVVEQRAEQAARTALRGRLDLVVARGMGPPAATAECAAGFLLAGGRLVVSEPPTADPKRWSDEGLAILGAGRPCRAQSSSGAHFVVITQETRCPDRFPRRTGQPTKRPLF